MLKTTVLSPSSVVVAALSLEVYVVYRFNFIDLFSTTSICLSNSECVQLKL